MINAMNFLKQLKEIEGDASFRKFYRNKKNNSIIVVAKKEKNKNLLIYDAINKILIKNKILAPKLINQNYHKNFIEIQDLGTKTIYQLLKQKKINNYLMLKKAVNILKNLQLIKNKKIKNFKNQLYKIKEYHNQVLYNETKLFCDWYVSKKISKNKSTKFNNKFKKEVKYLLSKLHYKNDTFVHRDFHVSNLMYFDNKIGLIDSQDALIGNKAYDLASLIDDVRFKTPNKLKEKVYAYYLKKNNKIKARKFKIDFEILSVLRNLKIIGIFMRLSLRDNKKKYLKLIPYAWEMIDYRINQNKIFDNLKLLLKHNLPRLLSK
jgi:N-acetylmuramate 1-kinase